MPRRRPSRWVAPYDQGPIARGGTPPPILRGTGLPVTDLTQRPPTRGDVMTVSRCARWILQCAAAFLLAGCASVEPPSVTLSSLQMQQSTIFEQRFLTTLRIQNPNDFDLGVEGLSFDLAVNDQPFATGVGRSNTVIPAFGSGVVEAEAITTLSGFIRQFQTLTRAGGPKLSYHLTGKLRVSNRPFSVPFVLRGEDPLPLQPGPTRGRPASPATTVP